jgi:hypothetical protein
MIDTWSKTTGLRSHRRALAVSSMLLLSGCGGVASGSSTSILSPDAGGGTNTAGGVSSVPSGGAGGEVTGGSGGGAVSGGSAGQCQDCLPVDSLYWGMNGGLVYYIDTSSLGSCRTYNHMRDYMTDALPMCTQMLPACPDRTMDRIVAAINDADFTAALKNHTLYGSDPRAYDGQVFRISIGRDYIDVGTPCYDTPNSCTMPSAIAELVTELQALDQIELATDACVAIFGN